jgi:hypothetical protein
MQSSGNAGLMESVANKKAVSLVFAQTLEIAIETAISHISTALLLHRSAVNDPGCAPQRVQRRPLGREVLQIKTPRFVQWTIFVTSDGALTNDKEF